VIDCEEETMDSSMTMFLVLFWCGPIGLGVFLSGLGVYYWGRSRAERAK
jgi:hypothetical protein